MKDERMKRERVKEELQKCVFLLLIEYCYIKVLYQLQSLIQKSYN